MTDSVGEDVSVSIERLKRTCTSVADRRALDTLLRQAAGRMNELDEARRLLGDVQKAWFAKAIVDDEDWLLGMQVVADDVHAYLESGRTYPL